MSCKAIKCIYNIQQGCAFLGFFPEARIDATGKCELYNENSEYYEKLVEQKRGENNVGNNVN